jgi:hypothetical protein
MTTTAGDANMCLGETGHGLAARSPEHVRGRWSIVAGIALQHNLIHLGYWRKMASGTSWNPPVE